MHDPAQREKVPLEDQAEYLVTQWMSVKQFEAAGGALVNLFFFSG